MDAYIVEATIKTQLTEIRAKLEKGLGSPRRRSLRGLGPKQERD